MDNIYFVTSNKGKVASAQRLIDNVELVAVSIDLIEPRTDDITEIAKYKAEQAFEETGKPCIVLDAGFFIESLNGFPRAYVNHMLDTIGVEGVLKLLQDSPNRNAAFRECLAYTDGIETEFFYGESAGTIATEIYQTSHAKQWSPLWNIFIPNNCDKVLAAMTDDERYHRPDGHTSPFTEFNEYIGRQRQRR